MTGTNTTRRWPSPRAERIARIVWIVVGVLLLPTLLIAATGGLHP
jgi:hypothetical protein